MRWFALLLAPLAGCFTAKHALYTGEKALTPLNPGLVTIIDPEHPKERKPARPDVKGGVYRLSDGKSGEVTRFRLYALTGTPLLVAETADGCAPGDKGCSEKSGANYLLVRLTPGRAEWASPDCGAALSKLSGIRIAADSCEFFDRAGLDKALRIAAAMPWKAGGVYLLAP